MSAAGLLSVNAERFLTTILKYIQTKRIGSLAIALAFGVAGSIPVGTAKLLVRFYARFDYWLGQQPFTL
jgi:hypothetical protein